MQGLTPAGVIHLTPNVWTEPFWAATAEHRLVLPRCTACSAFRFPPTPFCWRCRAQDVDWIEHDGHGSIYSTPDTGQWSVHGDILDKWASMGWETSCLGYPISDEFGISDGRQTNFQHGDIMWPFSTHVASAACAQ